MLTVNNGLSQGMIFDMLQSKDGFPWIATKDGLNRYDGARFEVFSPDPFDPFAIGNSEVQRLFEDSRGWIWVMLPVGLDVFDPEDSGRFFHVKHEGKPIRTGSIAETPDGVIWIPERERILKISLQKDLLAKAAKQGKADIEPTCKAILLSNVSDWSGEPLQALFLHFTKEKKTTGKHEPRAVSARLRNGANRARTAQHRPLYHRLVVGMQDRRSFDKRKTSRW